MKSFTSMTALQNALEFILVKYFLHCAINRPFVCYPKALFQSEARCKPINLKMIFILIQIKTIFTSFALNFVLKVRVFRSRKWPIFQHLK